MQMTGLVLLNKLKEYLLLTGVQTRGGLFLSWIQVYSTSQLPLSSASIPTAVKSQKSSKYQQRLQTCTLANISKPKLHKQ